ncbi:MAG: RAMP superfamily CRISPR-associated protein [Candidatus Korarchaeum sp.]
MSSYKFVYVGETKRQKNRRYEKHSSIREVHRIGISLITESPVHVGSGRAQPHSDGPLMLNTRSREGELIIPGSTLKGVVSHYYLALTADIESTSNLFGFPGYMSRALFSDSLPVECVKPDIVEVVPSWKPKMFKRRHIKIYRSDMGLEMGRGIFLECIPKGTTLRSEVLIINPIEGETAKLLLAMGYVPGNVKVFLLGFGKPKGLGKVRVKEVKIHSIDVLGNEREIDISESIEKALNQFGKRFEEVFG